MSLGHAGKPARNACLKRSNKTRRAGVPDCRVFELLQEVSDMMRDFLQRTTAIAIATTHRPHDS